MVKTYKTGVGGFTAIDGITLDIHRGEFLGIIGKSGAGKTTLLNLISGVSRITSGKILFYPQDEAGSAGTGSVLSIGEMSQDELAAWRGTNMGIVYQSFELMPQLDLVNNIMLPQEFAGHFPAGHQPGTSVGIARYRRIERACSQAASAHLRRAKTACGHRQSAGQRSAHHRRR